ncbi:hypothetical protein AB0E88_23055 [Streptomyces sp. NPDC028635]|uniref:hypothetical protein n=1 Tax=Streptomyces sp. NPDC028635 TaxID=3154800 RepID=UPI003411C834
MRIRGIMAALLLAITALLTTGTGAACTEPQQMPTPVQGALCPCHGVPPSCSVRECAPLASAP